MCCICLRGLRRRRSLVFDRRPRRTSPKPASSRVFHPGDGCLKVDEQEVYSFQEEKLPLPCLSWYSARRELRGGVLIHCCTTSAAFRARFEAWAFMRAVDVEIAWKGQTAKCVPTPLTRRCV